MKNKTRSVELCTSDGRVILILNLYEKEIGLKDNPEVAQDQKTEKTKDQVGNRKTEDRSITVAQKRYLFRILAENGIEGDKAHEHLKNLFQVDSLKDVTKLEASKMIERLIEEAKGGSDGSSI